ncbi:MAG: TlpA family protein disulfide reductase [Bellilinea sp.]
MTVDNDIQTQEQSHRLPSWVVVVAFTGLVAFLVLVGLGLRRAQSGPITVGQKVPDFSLTTFEGQTINTKDYAGKVILVNFWASWCKPCEQEAYEMEEAYQYYKPGGEVLFLGVDWVDTEPEALGFINKFGLTYANGPDLGTKIGQMFRIQGVPETYVIDRDGRLAFVKKGPFLSTGEIQMVIDQLLQ